MKLLRVKATNFKNCCDEFTIDLTPKAPKTAEDKEYELLEIAPELYVYSTAAFIGKNASGKTTAIELLDCAYSILENFRLEGKHYNINGVRLEITFYHDDYIYRYETELSSNNISNNNQALFDNEKLFSKKYYKSKVNQIFEDTGYEKVDVIGILPDDTSNVFFILKKKDTRAVFFDSYGSGEYTYQLLFRTINNYGIDTNVLAKIIRIFDDSIKALKRIDDHNYCLITEDNEQYMTDSQLIYYLSSGTTKGVLLYSLMVASLKEGFDLIIDEIENHFHKTLVENMLSLYRDKSVNQKNATLFFTTHYCEILDHMGRQDNIWICRSNGQIHIDNMYETYNIRSALLKSNQYYKNTFKTAVNYEHLMDLKNVLKR